MVLEVYERLGLTEVLIPEGNLVYLKARRDLISKVGLSADEIKEYEVVQKDNLATWNPKKVKEKDIQFTGGESAMIVDALRELEKTEKLKDHQVSLYEKFVEGENNG